MFSHNPGLGRLSPHFFRLTIMVCQIRHCFSPIINKRHPFGLFHFYACVRVVSCINDFKTNTILLNVHISTER